MASIIQTGPGSWRVQIRRKGHKPITRTFRTERLARRFADEAERAVEDGRPVPAGSMPTVTEVVRAFRELRETAGRPVDPGANEHYMLNHLEDGMGGWRLDTIDPKRLASWCRTRAEEGAGPATIGMEVSKLATVIRHAATWMHRPLPDVVAPARALLEYSGLIGQAKSRDRRPTVEEIERLVRHFDATEPVMSDLLLLAVGSAMRRSELCRIRWADIDEERRMVLVRDRKHPRKKRGNHQWVPLLGDTLQLLLRQPRTEDRIFPVEPGWISDTFKEACDALGIVDLHFHDLKHEATSRLFEAGYQIHEVALVTGHRKWEHLRRYTNLRPEHLSSPETASRPGTAPRPGGQRTTGPGPGRSEPEIDPR